jgi:hypothetical protein
MSKINIDFEVRSDLYYLKVLDFSVWGLSETKPAIIEITLPGYAKYVTHYFDKHKTNLFQSITLDQNCVNCSEESTQPLLDGIYLFTVKASPSTFYKTRKFLKTDSIQMDIDRIYIDSFSNQSRELIINKLSEIEFLLKSAEANLRYDLEKECMMLFEQARKMVDKLNDCSNC